MKNVIVIQKDDKVEVYGCLTRLCLLNPGFSYHYLRSLKFPFNMYGWRFTKQQIKK
jgi:hypothetical protein